MRKFLIHHLYMKSLPIAAAVCALAGVSSAFAGTIDFENIPTTFMEPNTIVNGVHGGGQDLGTFFQNLGVTFGAGAQVTATSTTFPAHSGQFELTDANPSISTITINFTKPQTDVSFWYNAFFGLTIQAFNGATQVGTTIAEGSTVNPLNSVGTTEFLSLTEGTGFTSLVITDDVPVQSGDITIDDLSSPGIAPDATSTLLLFGVTAVGLAAFRRKLAVQ
jgi:hypothetical protein